MRKLNLILLLLTPYATTTAQSSVVNWTFSATKTAEKTYEIHFIAQVQPLWHIYSQASPDDGAMLKFRVLKKSLVSHKGSLQRIGQTGGEIRGGIRYQGEVFYRHCRIHAGRQTEDQCKNEHKGPYRIHGLQ